MAYFLLNYYIRYMQNIISIKFLNIFIYLIKITIDIYLFIYLCMPIRSYNNILIVILVKICRN